MTQALPPAPRAIAITLGGMIAMAVGIGVGRFVYTPILPPMIAALGLSKATAGLIASANFLGYLCGAMGVTRLSPRRGRRPLLLGALLTSALTTAAMGCLVPGPGLLSPERAVLGFIAIRFLGGLASAMVLILATALVLDQLGLARRPGLAAVHFAGVGVGIAISAALVATLGAAGLGWSAMWQASGGASALGLIAVACLLPASDAKAAPSGLPAAAADGGLRRMTVAYGLFGFGYVITATFLVAIVRGEPAARAMEPVIWILVGLAAAPSVWFWGFLGRRFGTAAAFGAAALTEALGVVASVASGGMIAVSLGALLLGGTFMGLTAMGLTRARELARGDASRAMAAMTGAFGAGQIVGPTVAGVLSDVAGGFTVPSALAAAALVLSAWLATRREPVNATAPARTETGTAR